MRPKGISSGDSSELNASKADLVKPPAKPDAPAVPVRKKHANSGGYQQKGIKSDLDELVLHRQSPEASDGKDERQLHMVGIFLTLPLEQESTSRSGPSSC